MMVFYLVIYLVMCQSVKSETVPVGTPTVNAFNVPGANENDTSHNLDECPTPDPKLCSASLTMSDTFYGMLVNSFEKVHGFKDTLTSVGAEFTALFHYYECYLDEFSLAEVEVKKALDGFNVIYGRVSAYKSKCYSVSNQYVH